MDQRARNGPGQLAPEFAERLFGAYRVIGQDTREFGDQSREVALLCRQLLHLGTFVGDAPAQRGEQALPAFKRGIESPEFLVSGLCEVREARLLGRYL